MVISNFDTHSYILHPGLCSWKVNLSQFTLRLNPRPFWVGLKNFSRPKSSTPSFTSQLPVLCVIYKWTCHLTPTFPHLYPCLRSRFHRTWQSQIPIRLGHSRKLLHQVGRKIRINKYFHLLWNIIGSLRFWKRAVNDIKWNSTTAFSTRHETRDRFRGQKE